MIAAIFRKRQHSELGIGSGRGGPRARLRGATLWGTESGRGAKLPYWSPCWAHRKVGPRHDMPVSSSPFCNAPAPRLHHACTTPHRRDQASVLHGGYELKGHLCDLGTHALVCCGMPRVLGAAMVEGGNQNHRNITQPLLVSLTSPQQHAHTQVKC